jgi:hypothetical protein
VLFTDVEHRAYLLHCLLHTKRPQTLELGVVRGQTDRDDLGKQIDGSEDAVVIIDAVYVDTQVTFGSRGNGLIPSRAEDGRKQVACTGGYGLALV